MAGGTAGPAGVQAAYDRAADGWGLGAAKVYAPLARALVATSPVGLAGRLVLDVGAGTGVASEALRVVGARPLAFDLSHGMLAWRHAERPPAAVCDVLALPVRGGAAGGAVAAFLLNHLEQPVAALSELARVVGPGGPVLASVFSNAEQTEVKDAVDAVVAAWGWTPPDWYVAIKHRIAPRLGTPEALATAAAMAGLGSVRAVERRVDVGLRSPEELVTYRLGQAHVASFLAALPAPERQRLRAAAVAAVAAVAPEPLRPAVIFLSAQAPGRRSASP
jgi:ubiquinone/menaquinone biosynthesis C-methylase UbiE